MFKKLDKIQLRYADIERSLQDISLNLNPEKRIELLKEYVSIGKLVTLYKQYQNIVKDKEIYQKVVSDNKEEKEFINLAKEEIELLTAQQNTVSLQLKNCLVPKDPLDEKNIIMEIRPAAGGNESSLFCEDLFIMYSHYASHKKWTVDIISSTPGNTGGLKEIIFSISGLNVYSFLKYESGVHRVQRVPKTETQGRIHTSTVTVVVLPSIDATTMKINPTDIRIDTFRSSGSGGQHVNTTDSAIRVLHIPTQTMVQCQDGKSQHANKDKALKVLYARLYALEDKKKQDTESKARLSQIGTGDRSEKIRTYNFPQSRITDHRVCVTLYNLESLMSSGDLTPLIKCLKEKQTELFFENKEV